MEPESTPIEPVKKQRGRPRGFQKKVESPTVRETAPVQEEPVVVATATVPAPVFQAPMPQAPRQMRIERQGSRSEPYVHHFPQVRGGICEFCGVMDVNSPSQVQYKLCPHYRGMQLQCSYCPAEKDPDEVIRQTKLEIVQHPDKPWEMIVVCSSYTCEQSHQKRFQRAA
jgi:hypothetical protein